MKSRTGFWAFQVTLVVKNLTNQETSETQFWSLGQEDSLEEGLVTYSSVLDRRPLWTEEPRELQCMGSQIVRHNWSDLACMNPQSWILEKINKIDKLLDRLIKKKREWTETK